MQLLIATRNPHKLAEIKAIMSLPGLTLVGAHEISGLPTEVLEDGDTFEANALKKARTLCRASGLWTLADDSGLEVEVLNNAPGVYSARYAGSDGDDAANNKKLLRQLSGYPRPRARFRCALALCAPDGRHWHLDGICAGYITQQPRGQHGFGYDPLFIPDGYTQTFAELESDIKNKISHRAQALTLAVTAWHQYLQD